MWAWVTSSEGAAIATWLQAIGTVGALIWLTLDFTIVRPRNRKADETDRQWAHARSVSFRTQIIGGGGSDYPMEYEILNASPFPVSDAHLAYRQRDEQGNWKVVWGRWIGVILPQHTLANDDVRIPGTEFTPLAGEDWAVLTFVDVWGQKWNRTQRSVASVGLPATRS